VIDDRMPAVGWPQVGVGDTLAGSEHTIEDESARRREQAALMVANTGARNSIEVLHGRPGSALLAAAAGADLLVMGSRRWGPAARVLCASTGEAIAQNAPCSILVVPRTNTARSRQ
jgi:nucleotide-binding universal stress UspA family protein